ncbi:hypothetical protein DO72_5703 [Burkholderia pseudomallei]|nr:hypothetical protein DO72_5703 [Burkholderia pseudomallei]KGD44711.1 hypothetical protein DP44_5856 [Burkholderia pseudomallei]KGD58628.1 hypothetical protein DP49_5911 [Burkholderia pseudomallei]KGX75101.1 hypothetical protein Y033_5824 [Burkholderia pseudomallei MSHR435]
MRTALYHENTSIRTSKIPRSFRAFPASCPKGAIS